MVAGVPTTVESQMAAQIGLSFGSPFILALMVGGFFLAYVMLQNTRLDGKIVILVPALFLCIAIIPLASLILAFIISGVLYLAYTRFTGR